MSTNEICGSGNAASFVDPRICSRTTNYEEVREFGPNSVSSFRICLFFGISCRSVNGEEESKEEEELIRDTSRAMGRGERMMED